MPAGLKILFIASRFPYPPLQGDRVRAFHQLKHLARRHRITLIAPVCSESEARNLGPIEPLCERVVAVPISGWNRMCNLLAAPFSSLPWQTSYWHHSKIAEAVSAACAQQEFDIVHVQLVRSAPAGLALNGIPRVLDFIDALSLNLRRRSDRQSGLARVIFAHEARRLWKYETQLLRLYDRTLISSRMDRDFICNDERIHVIPNGVDVEAFPFHEGPRDPNLIIFTGRMGYFPNVDGAQWFVREVLPIVRGTRPAARFVIAGADPGPRVRALARPAEVQVTGYVPDLAACLRRASVAVSPLRSGSGMQFKALEAMASGTPAVVTPYSIGGLDAGHEKHLLVASTAEDFAGAIIRLLQDRELCLRIAREARSLVEARYTWEHSVAAMETVYRLAVEDRCRAAA